MYNSEQSINKLIEELAKELYEKNYSEQEYLSPFGMEKPLWINSPEHNKDDYRLLAKIAINWAKNKQMIKVSGISRSFWNKVGN